MTLRDAVSLLDLVAEPATETADRAEPGYARIAAAIRHMIISNEVRPGTWLRLQALAARFGVSMQPVREALHILHGEGLVELQPNRGARVRGLDRNRLIHVYEIRAGIASIMARRFAEEASGSEIRALERFQAEHDAAIEARDFTRASRVNKAFHDLIYGRGGNQEALALVHRYRDLSGSVRARIGYSDAHWDRVRQEHHALLDAIRRHDGAAAGDVGARHVLNLLEDVLQALDTAGAQRSAAETE
jgi:DNA-binding GntR family transcriptional regulator